MTPSGLSRIWTVLVITLLFVVLPTGMASAQETPSAKDERPTVKLAYFYENPCAACDDGAEFRQRFTELVGEHADGVDVQIDAYNTSFSTFQTDGLQKIKEYYRLYDVPEGKRTRPILFIQDTFLVGEQQIKTQLREAFIKAKRNLTQSRIIYFYISPCEDCTRVKKLFRTLETQYPVQRNGYTIDSELSIEMFNIGKFDNMNLLGRYFQEYGVPDKEMAVPIVFTRDGYLAGADAIERELVREIGAGSFIGTSGLEMENTRPDAGSSGTTRLSGYKLAGVFLTGLVNGLNPCSISMLLFFISLILMKNASVLKLGLSFIAGKFTAYTLFGTLLFTLLSAIDMSWFSTFELAVKIVATMILATLAVMNILDFFAARKEKYSGIKMQLPARLRRWNHRWMERLTSVGNQRLLVLISFLLGIIISAGEMLCTGQIYLATIIYVLQTSPGFDLFALACFVLYGFAIVVPLAVLMIVIHRGREVFLVSELVRSNMPLIKLLTAILFIALAVVLFIL